MKCKNCNSENLHVSSYDELHCRDCNRTEIVDWINLVNKASKDFDSLLKVAQEILTELKRSYTKTAKFQEKWIELISFIVKINHEESIEVNNLLDFIIIQTRKL